MTVRRTSAFWGALAGIGAFFVATALMYATIELLFWTVEYFDPKASLLIAATFGSVFGAAVARAAGGLVAAVTLAIYVAAGVCVTVGYAISDELRAAADPGFYFIDHGALEIGLAQVPSAVGLVVGFGFALQMGGRRTGPNALVEAAGAFAVAAVVVMGAYGVSLGGFIDPRFAPLAAAGMDLTPHAVVVAAEALSVGAVLAIRRGAARWPFAAAAALAVLALLTVFPSEFTNWLNVFRYGWVYWPLSLVGVPIATFVVAALPSVVARAGRPPHP